MSVSLTKHAAEEPGIPGSSRYTIKPSDIHGLGVFARKQFVPGEFIGVAFVVRKGPIYTMRRTELGRFVNYSDRPNALVLPVDPELFWAMVATRSIGPGEEILCDYCETYALADRVYGPTGWAIPRGYIRFRKWLPTSEPPPMDLPCRSNRI